VPLCIYLHRKVFHKTEILLAFHFSILHSDLKTSELTEVTNITSDN